MIPNELPEFCFVFLFIFVNLYLDFNVCKNTTFQRYNSFLRNPIIQFQRQKKTKTRHILNFVYKFAETKKLSISQLFFTLMKKILFILILFFITCTHVYAIEDVYAAIIIFCCINSCFNFIFFCKCYRVFV